MKKIAGIIVLILGVYMMYLGGIKAPKLMLPPLVSGIAFSIIGLVFFFEKRS